MHENSGELSALHAFLSFSCRPVFRAALLERRAGAGASSGPARGVP
ncbi:hypothetical protein WMF37_25070 [Sorangium sp. So ce291]